MEQDGLEEGNWSVCLGQARYSPTWETRDRLNNITWCPLVHAKAVLGDLPGWTKSQYSPTGVRARHEPYQAGSHHPLECMRTGSEGRFCRGLVASPLWDCNICQFAQRTGVGNLDRLDHELTCVRELGLGGSQDCPGCSTHWHM